MSSEHTPPNVIQLNRPHSPHHGKPNPASLSQEGDPFSSGHSSPNRYPSNIDTGTGNVLHTNPNLHPYISHSTSMEQHADRDGESFVPLQANSSLGADHLLPPLPYRLPEADPSIRRQRTADASMSAARRLNIPLEGEKDTHGLTIKDRLQPMFVDADKEKKKYEEKARMTGIALSVALGLQILLGSLTTGLSAVAATGGKSAAVQTTILGGLATVVTSYLALAKGSNEPELSNTRVKNLEQFIRDCKAFEMDSGHVIGDVKCEHKLEEKRRRFEEILGNANGEKKTPPV